MIWTLLLLGCVACTEQGKVEAAEQALRSGDLLGAEGRYRDLLDNDPDQIDALYGLGWLYHLNGDQDRAREYFKRCIRVAPGDYRGHRGLGSVAMAENNRAQARQHYMTALDLAPGEPRVLTSLGLLELVVGQDEAALSWFDQAAAKDPGRGDLGYYRALALHRLGRNDEALQVIDTSLAQSIEERRFQGLLLEQRAIVLVVMTSGRVDPANCAATAPPVLAWLDEADRNVEQALSLEVELPDIYATRRRVHRRRSVVSERCPGQTASDLGKLFPPRKYLPSHGAEKAHSDPPRGGSNLAVKGGVPLSESKAPLNLHVAPIVSSRAHRRAVTMIELLVTLGLISVLAAVGIGMMLDTVPRFRMVKAAKDLRMDIAQLRNTAATTNRETRLLLVDADTNWKDPDLDSVAEYHLQVGDAAIGSTSWDTLPADAEDDGTDDDKALGLVVLSRYGKDEIRGVSLKPWSALRGPAAGNADAIVFSPRGFVNNPDGDFGSDGYITLTLVNKSAFRRSVEDSVSVKVARSGNTAMISSLSGEELNGVGTAARSSEGS